VLKSMTIDFVASVLTLDVEFWVGDMDMERREIYRPGRVTISGLSFIVIDSPHQGRGPFTNDLDIDGAEGEPENSKVPLPKVEPGCFRYWIFVHKWNGFIRFAARSASFEWTGPEVDMEAACPSRFGPPRPGGAAG